MENTARNLAPNALALFVLYWNDACNWGGEPMVGGNVSLLGSKGDRGLLTHLKVAGVVATYVSDGNTFLRFTAEGKQFGASLGMGGWWV